MTYESDYGRFITVEGIDGAGKSSLVEALGERYPDAITTHEPTNTWSGNAVEEAKKDGNELAAFYAFLTDRAKHVEEVIKPKTSAGYDVISDRYLHSTYAYQTELLKDHIEYRSAESFVWENLEVFPWPDVCIYIDVPVEVALERCSGEMHEYEDLLRSVKANFESQLNFEAGHEMTSVIEVDGTQPQEDIIEAVSRRLAEHGVGTSNRVQGV